MATANSILMVTFANDERATVPLARDAMLSAGYARLRPVLMTAAAMMLGMLPMALGLGEGGEQNAPLGRAVIGGLLGATITTLFVVPIIYSLSAHQASRRSGAAPGGGRDRGRGCGLRSKSRRMPTLPVDQMSDRRDHESPSSELRRQLEDLKRQLEARHDEHAGPPANRWKPSRTTISALLLACLVLLRRARSSPAICRCSSARRRSRRSGARRKATCRAWQ